MRMIRWCRFSPADLPTLAEGTAEQIWTAAKAQIALSQAVRSAMADADDATMDERLRQLAARPLRHRPFIGYDGTSKNADHRHRPRLECAPR